MPSRRLAPDTALKISLEAGARRRLEDGMPFEVVVEELRAEASGRTDLLAHAAGNLIGLYLSRPTATQPRSIAAFAALVLAGADPQALVARAHDVRALIRRPARP